MAKSLEDYTREELIETVKSLKSRKKFGLVWEDKPEQVAEDCKKKLPVLVEIEDKAVELVPDEQTNFIIEGDNYHALSVLNYTHVGKIDTIYIDPPYNTGAKDWRYNNRYVDGNDSFAHSKWISMMSKRLRLAKNLLCDTGTICVTIDDYEIGSLRLLMDEIFGENNRLGQVTIEHNPRGRTDDKFFATSHEYALFYGKDKTFSITNKLELTDEQQAAFNLQDEHSKYRLLPLKRTGSNSTPNERPKLFFPIYIHRETKEFSTSEEHSGQADWVEVLPIDTQGNKRVWRWGKEKIEKEWQQNLVVKIIDGKASLFTKDRIKEGRRPKTVWVDPKYDASSHGSVLIEKILGNRKAFSYPKSINAVRDTLNILAKHNPSAIILDFFAGSGTTGQAVLELNKEDGGHRQFILCTNNENKIAEEVTYPRVKTVITGKREDGSIYSDGIPANLRYFKTSFVDKNDTLDKLRRELSPACEDMIRIREGAFEKVIDEDMLKVFKNSRGLTAVIYDRFDLDNYIEKIEALETDAPVHLYVFSYDKGERSDQIPKTAKHTYESQPIPEGVLEVYKRIFR